MELDRRQAILSVAMALVARPARAKPERIESELHECHQLTRSLIERARLASTATNRVDLDAIDRLIRQTADRAAIDSPPVIKWLTSPTDAFDHLRKLDSSELGTNLAALWRVRRSCLPCNEEAFERSFESPAAGVRHTSARRIRPDTHGTEVERYLRNQACWCISDGAATGESRLLRDRLVGDVLADFVIIHGRFSGTGFPRTWIAADVVRIADGVLAEHWDVLQDEAARAESKSGLPMFGDSFTD